MFVDEAEVEVRAGRGGDGVSSFLREPYNPKGGPNGGDGGRGGDVIFEATKNEHTLSAFKHVKKVEAEDGHPGEPRNKRGADGDDKQLSVPVGTVIEDARTGDVLADLTEEGQTFTVARGGDRGLGNAHFASSTNRAPRKTTPGEAGERRFIRLQLKLIADVALVGFPSVGKSTVVSVLSAAKPRTGDYPFTTQNPNLGTVAWKDYRSYVVADIPGLIEGAHKGRGLGTEFLKHIERTNFIVHLLEVFPDMEGVPSDRDPLDDYRVIRSELEAFSEDLAQKPELIVLNKIDLPYVREQIDRIREFAEQQQKPFVPMSAATGENVQTLKDILGRAVYEGDLSASATSEWWERDSDAESPSED